MPGVTRTFVALDPPTTRRAGAGGHACQGLWHAPAGRARPAVGVIASHFNVDFSEHYLAPLLAERGIGVLGWNTRFRGSDSWFLLGPALVDVGAGVRWLRQSAGVTTVVLLGNSGGATLMAAYQAAATAGLPATGAPAGDVSLHTGATGAPGPPGPPGPPGDLYVSLQAHPGRPEVLTNWLDPSVTDESDPLSCDPALDMYDAGRHPVPYDASFVAAYRAAQVARNERITDACLAELQRIGAAGVGDRLFTVPRTWADLRFWDAAIDPSDRPAGRCLAGDPRRANAGPAGLAACQSLRTWLELWSLRCSPCRGAPNLARVHVPSIVVQSTADTSVFPSDARAVHAALGASDAPLVWTGGDHYLETPTTARAEVADLLAAWITERAG